MRHLLQRRVDPDLGGDSLGERQPLDDEYVNEAGDEVTVVQIHPDTASMEAHMGIVSERAREAYAETLDATVRVQVFGQSSDAILETLRQQAGNGVDISVNGEHLGGFTRSAAQR